MWEKRMTEDTKADAGTSLLKGEFPYLAIIAGVCLIFSLPIPRITAWMPMLGAIILSIYSMRQKEQPRFLAPILLVIAFALWFMGYVSFHHSGFSDVAPT